MSSPLFNLYSWITGTANVSVTSVIKELLDKNSFTKAFIENEMNATKEQLASLVRDARIKNMSEIAKPQENTTQSSVFSNPGECQKFLDFLQDFHKVTESNSFTLDEIYDFAFDYLAKRDSHTKKAKGQTLFMSFLDADADGARRWYANHQELAQVNFPSIPFLVSDVQQEKEEKPLNTVAQVAERKKQIQSLLQFEENVAGILPLFQKSVHDVAEFAALLLEALERGVSSEQILDSGILSDFIGYHLHYSGTEDEIKHLFNLLEQFKAGDLVAKAKGTLMKKDQYILPVTSAQQIEHPISFTVTQQNLDNLVQLFGESFLIPACRQLAETDEPGLQQWLTAYLDQLFPASLGAFINEAGKSNNTHLLQLLAHLLSADASEKLLEAHQGAIFYLVPYSQDILNAVNDLNSLKNHIAVLKSSGQDIDVVAQMAVLLNGIEDNPDITELLIDNLLDLFIKNPSLADDDELVHLMSTLAIDWQTLIQKKADVLLHEWHERFNELLVQKNYPAIEDLWKDMSSAFSLLQEFGSQTNFPQDKYILYATIVKNLVNEADFQLEDFLNQVLPYEEQTEDISTRERALLEILMAVDNDAIRQSAQALLKDRPWQLWIEQIYETSPMDVIISNGNLGFIQSSITSANEGTIQYILKKASSLGQLEIVKFICLEQKDKLGAKAIQIAIEYSLNERQFEIAQFLCNLDIESESIKEKIKEELIAASSAGALDIVQFLCSLTTDNKPDSETIVWALDEALNKRQLDVVKFLSSLTTDNRIDKETFLYFKSIFSHDKDLLNILNDAIKIEELREYVDELKKYLQQNFSNDVDFSAMDQTSQFTDLINTFVKEKSQDFQDINLSNLRNEFKNAIQKSYQNMGDPKLKAILDKINTAAVCIGLNTASRKRRLNFFPEEEPEIKVPRTEEAKNNLSR